ncbi:MAG: hypothetical protein WA432_04415 [Candidatus Babeliaceae bacterium]
MADRYIKKAVHNFGDTYRDLVGNLLNDITQDKLAELFDSSFSVKIPKVYQNIENINLDYKQHKKNIYDSKYYDPPIFVTDPQGNPILDGKTGKKIFDNQILSTIEEAQAKKIAIRTGQEYEAVLKAMQDRKISWKEVTADYEMREIDKSLEDKINLQKEIFAYWGGNYSKPNSLKSSCIVFPLYRRLMKYGYCYSNSTPRQIFEDYKQKPLPVPKILKLIWIGIPEIAWNEKRSKHQSIFNRRLKKIRRGF